MKKASQLGGEFYYSPILLFKKKRFVIEDYLIERFPGKHFFFTSGGLSSLYVILDAINPKGDQKVLLPSYLCPSMLIPFKRKGIHYSFYKINSKLEIDIDDLLLKANESVAALLFINYFGFRSNLNNEDILSKLRKKNIIIIEDAVQSFFSDFTPVGDYIFNSFRKFTPVNGSIIISHKKIDLNLKKSNHCYQIAKTFGLWLRWLRWSTGIPIDKLYLALFQYADKKYNSVLPARFTNFNKQLLSRFDFESLKFRRKSNFEYLSNEFAKYAIYKNLPSDTIPLGFPVLIQNRNEIRKKLIDKNIFCPIHWMLSEEIDKNEFADSWDISKRIMTIPINEDISSDDKKNIIKMLNQINVYD